MGTGSAAQPGIRGPLPRASRAHRCWGRLAAAAAGATAADIVACPASAAKAACTGSAQVPLYLHARALAGNSVQRLPPSLRGAQPPPRARAAAPRAAAHAAGGGAGAWWALPASFVSVAVINRVSNRVLLVPLARHTYFLAVASGLTQLAFYAAWFGWSRRQGLVTPIMERFARARAGLLAAFGALEGAFFPLVFYAAAHLPGGLVQVLNQTLIPCTVLFSALLLRRKYDNLQLMGVAVVIAGVLLVAVAPNANHPPTLHPQNVYVALCVGAYALMAMAMVVKEVVFLRYKKWIQDHAPEAEREPEGAGDPPLDISLFLAVSTLARVAVLLLGWPLFLLVECPSVSVQQSAAAGTAALFSPGVLRLAALYWACNAGVSVTAILMVRRMSAAATVLANVVALPLSALLFSCHLPGLPPQAFQWTFVVSLILVVFGNLLYSHDVLQTTSRRPKG